MRLECSSSKAIIINDYSRYANKPVITFSNFYYVFDFSNICYLKFRMFCRYMQMKQARTNKLVLTYTNSIGTYSITIISK